MLVFVYMVNSHFLNVKIHVQVHFTNTSHFYVHINVKLYLHAFAQIYGGEKTGMLNVFYN